MTRNALTKRAGPLFGAWLVVVGMVLAVSPVIPPVSAIDPTPEPAVTPVATPVPEPTPEPIPVPSPDPTAAASEPPAPDPTAAASEPPTPEPTAAASEPPPEPSAPPGVEPSAPPSADPGASITPSPTPAPTEAPADGGLKVQHFWIDQENEAGAIDDAGAMDDPRIGLTRFVAYRVRFQVLNDGEAAVEIRPSLLGGDGAQPDKWVELPATELEAGTPFYAAADNGGTSLVRTKAIPVGSFRSATSSDAVATPVEGLFSAGRNPAPALTMAPHTYTEIEFTVRATVDAQWKSAYAFRLALDAGVLDHLDAPVSLGAAPEVELTPGQKAGQPVEKPIPAYRLKSPTAVTARTAVAHPDNLGFAAPQADLSTSPHVQYSLTTDSCAACHSAHRATTDKVLLNAPESTPLSGLCFRCHDGTGASSDIQAQFANPAIPANDPATASYYSHPATVANNHTLDEDEEFGGVSNRHTECADCHQPHRADDTASTPTTSGWTAGGAIMGASGVAVTQGAANTVPTFTWQRTSDFEYQLCYKCHSGYTDLPTRDAAFPSRYALDKAAELNPANLSYHPVEAAGTNGTSQMDGSLAGTSPYKLWTFTSNSVVRCQNCHGPSTATSPAADGQIDNHASVNRGILLRNYKDRTVNTRTTAYGANDFALCYVCHAEAPMRDTSGNQRPDTNFRFHGLHVSGLQGEGSGTAGTSIDVDGAGAGNATCAECHFRIHGSSFPANNADPNPRLVNFAPNVQPVQGFLEFNRRVDTTPGTCALRCHSRDHEGLDY